MFLLIESIHVYHFVTKRAIYKPVTLTVLLSSLTKWERGGLRMLCEGIIKNFYRGKKTSLYKVIIAIIVIGIGKGQMSCHKLILSVL